MSKKIKMTYKLTCKPKKYRILEDGSIELVFTEKFPRYELMDDNDQYVDAETIGDIQSDMLWENFDHAITLTNHKGKSVNMSEDW